MIIHTNNKMLLEVGQYSIIDKIRNVSLTHRLYWQTRVVPSKNSFKLQDCFYVEY